MNRKVIHIHDNLSLIGGAEIYVEKLQNLLPAFGWETDWLVVRREAKRFQMVRYGAPAWTWEGTIEGFKSLLEAEFSNWRTRLIHIHSISDPAVVGACFDVAPVVRTMHDPRMFCPGQGKYWSKSEVSCFKPVGLHCLLHAYTERCCNRHPKRLLAGIRNTRFEILAASRKYAAIIASSQFMKTQAVLAGFPEQKITVLPCFTEKTQLVCDDIGSEIKRILFSGRLSRSKGVHYLLRSFALLGAECPDSVLDIAGAGGDEHYFVDLSEALGLKEKVRFYGWCDKVTLGSLIDRATVIAFPSLCPEAFGLSGIEGMMHGKPVVAYDVGGVRDWLVPGVTGILVPAKDVNEFAAGLRKLITNSEENLAMGRAARAYAMHRFSSESIATFLVSLYEQACERL